MWCHAMCCGTEVPTFWRKLLPAYSALKLQTAGSLKMCVSLQQMTWCHVLTDGNSDSYYCQNLRSHECIFILYNVNCMSCALSKFEVTIVVCLFSWSYACGQYLHGSVKDKTHGQYKQSTRRGWTWRHHPACSLGSFWTRTSVFNSFLSRCQSCL